MTRLRTGNRRKLRALRRRTLYAQAIGWRDRYRRSHPHIAQIWDDEIILVPHPALDTELTGDQQKALLAQILHESMTVPDWALRPVEYNPARYRK